MAAPPHLKKGDVMRDIRSLLKNYYFSRLEYQLRSRHDADYYSWLFPEGELTKESQALIALEGDILNQLKEDLETTLKAVKSMKTERYKTLITLRYLKNLEWSEIERLTGYNQQYLRGTMHEAAIKEVVKTQKEVYPL